MTLTRTVSVADTSFLLREHPADGRPVLLLHGVPETSSCWNDLAPQVAAAGRRVLAPDLPGLGGSSYSGPYDIASVVAQVAALVEAEAAGAVDVVGHDWGGAIALGLAGARPDLVRRLAVLHAPYNDVPTRAFHIPFLATPLVPELAFRLAGRRMVDLTLDLLWKSDRELDADRRAEYQAAYTDPAKVAAMLGYYRAAARPALAGLLPGRSAPPPMPEVKAERTLVVWGSADPVLPVSLAESLARQLGPDCVVVTVPGAGHFVVEEEPEVVAEVLLDFLAEPAGVGAPTPAPEAEGPARKAPAKKAPAKKAPAKKAPATKAAAKKAPPA
jgi:pimeloyl-ACP methyl ester carboxylesterase